jgi:hypothetical protein
VRAFAAVRPDGSLAPAVQVPPRALRTGDDNGYAGRGGGGGALGAGGESERADSDLDDTDDDDDDDDETHNCQGCGGGHLPHEILLCDHCDGARARARAVRTVGQRRRARGHCNRACACVPARVARLAWSSLCVWTAVVRIGLCLSAAPGALPVASFLF